MVFFEIVRITEWIIIISAIKSCRILFFALHFMIADKTTSFLSWRRKYGSSRFSAFLVLYIDSELFTVIPKIEMKIRKKKISVITRPFKTASTIFTSKRYGGKARIRMHRKIWHSNGTLKCHWSRESQTLSIPNSVERKTVKHPKCTSVSDQQFESPQLQKLELRTWCEFAFY